jgi:hypothetical protein
MMHGQPNIKISRLGFANAYHRSEWTPGSGFANAYHTIEESFSVSLCLLIVSDLYIYICIYTARNYPLHN